MSHKLVILIAVAVFYSAAVLGQTYFEVNRFELLDGKKCSSPLFTIVAQSDIACAARCAMDNACKSQFFTLGTRKCIGCDKVYHASDLAILEDESSSLYYRPYALYKQDCSTNNKPCIENNTVCFTGLNTCVCDPLFVYDPSTASCVSDCSTFGDTFQLYPKQFILLNDGFSHGFQDDVATCLSYCTNITTFTCYGVDYDYIAKLCYYNNAKLSTVSTTWTYSPAVFNAYIRNCA